MTCPLGPVPLVQFGKTRSTRGTHDRRIQSIEALAGQFKSDGIIYYTLQNCHDYNVEGVKVDRAMKAKDIPMLKIETDYSMGDAPQIQTRVEAFLEIIAGKKQA